LSFDTIVAFVGGFLSGLFAQDKCYGPERTDHGAHSTGNAQILLNHDRIEFWVSKKRTGWTDLNTGSGVAMAAFQGKGQKIHPGFHPDTRTGKIRW
jgi:hypothetical protein